MTAFRANDDKYLYKSFNIYTYPRFRDVVFKCQGDSMSFLADNGFDFNKLFRDGISCINLAYGEKRRTMLLEKQALRSAALKEATECDKIDISNHIPVSGDDQLWLTDVKEQIDLFLKSEEKEMVIDNKNGFQRKLIYQLIEANFHNKISTSNRDLDNKRKVLVIERKRSLEEESKLEAGRVESENREFEEMIGLSSIIKMVSESVSLFFLSLVHHVMAQRSLLNMYFFYN